MHAHVHTIDELHVYTHVHVSLLKFNATDNTCSGDSLWPSSLKEGQVKDTLQEHCSNTFSYSLMYVPGYE